MLVVTALWVGNQGVHQVPGGGAGALSSLGRLTGLLASDLPLIQVLLIARVPLAERAFGQDRLARWHRWSGAGGTRDRTDHESRSEGHRAVTSVAAMGIITRARFLPHGHPVRR